MQSIYLFIYLLMLYLTTPVALNLQCPTYHMTLMRAASTYSLAKVIHDGLKHQNWTCRSQDGQRLSREEAIAIPQTKPETRDSIAAMLLPVAWPKRPPNVMMGDRQAKYKNIHEAMHCRASASFMSDQYLYSEQNAVHKQL